MQISAYLGSTQASAEERGTIWAPTLLVILLRSLYPPFVGSLQTGSCFGVGTSITKKKTNLRRLDKPRSNTRSSKLQRWPQFVHICASCGLGS